MRTRLVQFCEAFHVKDITTDAMKDAIDEWYDLYYSRNLPEEEDDSQRLAVAVVNKIKKAVFSEYEAESDNEFAQTVLDALDAARKNALKHALVGGECWLKPLIFDERLDFAVVTRDNVVVLGRDARGTVTDIGTTESIERHDRYYTLMERRHVEGGRLIIESRLYESEKRDGLGHRVPLDTLEEYEGIESETEVPIDNLGLIPVICPADNCVDESDDPVSVYAAAAGLIHAANVTEAQFAGEFERGQSRIIVSNDLLRDTGRGKRLTDNVFVGVDDDPENIGINTFAPQLRDASFLARKEDNLRSIESLIGLKRGILSQVEAVERTATEITSSAGDYNLTIIDFQEAFETSIREAVRVCVELYRAYKMDYQEVDDDDVIISWGNGILYDRDKTWADYLAMVGGGLLKPEIAVAWYFDIPWKTDADLAKIRQDYMPQLQALMAGAV